jgi:signal recognition particle subunit SRP72
MAASTKSLSALLAQASLEDHDEVLKAANGAIKKSKSDVEAHHVKAIALLNLDRYEDALEVFENTQGLQEKASFEYAYALYKTGNAAKAVEIAEALGSDGGRGSKHMLAQAVRARDVESVRTRWLTCTGISLRELRTSRKNIQGAGQSTHRR